MIYNTMKKLILNANARYKNGYWDKEQFEFYKSAQQNKLDVFYANGRVTQEQYEELISLWEE